MGAKLAQTVIVLAVYSTASCTAQPGGPAFVTNRQIQPSTRQIASSASDPGLEAAVKRGDCDAVECALNLGADVNQDGGHALLLASSMGRSDIVALLLDRGAKANVRDKQGYTPLFCAAGTCCDAGPAMVRALIEHGADVNARCAAGMTPLQSACETGRPKSVGLLLASGADVNPIESSHGDTALHITAARVRAEQTHANVQIIDLLLGYGANVVARDADGKTPIDLWKTQTTSRFIVDPMISAEIHDILVAHAAAQQDGPVFP